MSVSWFLQKKHPIYGEVIMCGVLSGEPYRWLRDKHGVISMMPLSVLQEQHK